MCGEFLLTCGHLNVPALPSTWNNTGHLLTDYLQIDTVYFHSVCYRWRGLCSRWFECLCVWSWHFGCGEQSENGADRPVGLARLAPAFLASTRPEGKTVWGFWGFLESGSHWELSARQNPWSHLIYTYFTTLFSNSEHIWLFHRQQHFAA